MINDRLGPWHLITPVEHGDKTVGGLVRGDNSTVVAVRALDARVPKSYAMIELAVDLTQPGRTVQADVLLERGDGAWQ